MIYLKRKNILLAFFVSIITLSSCTTISKFSKRYQYDIELIPIEIVYYLDKNIFKYNEPINVNINYGHNWVIDDIPNENKNYPFVYFLDYDNNVLDDENNYSEYNGYKLIEEVDSKLFYTDEYSYFQEKYCYKSFNNTIEFDIPFNYFEHIYSVTPNFTIIKFIARQ